MSRGRLKWKAEQPQGGYRFGQVRIQTDPEGGYQLQGWKKGGTVAATLDERFRERWQAEMVRDHLASVGWELLPIFDSDARDAIRSAKARANAPLRPEIVRAAPIDPSQPVLF